MEVVSAFATLPCVSIAAFSAVTISSVVNTPGIKFMVYVVLASEADDNAITCRKANTSLTVGMISIVLASVCSRLLLLCRGVRW